MFKKIFLPGIIAAISMFASGMVIGLLFNQLTPSVIKEYENTTLFRAMEDPLMMLFYLSPFVLAFALAWVWDKTKGLFTGTLWKNAFSIAGAYFFVSTVPGMLITYSCFQVSLAMVLSWTISGFIQAYVGFLIIGRMNK